MDNVFIFNLAEIKIPAKSYPKSVSGVQIFLWEQVGTNSFISMLLFDQKSISQIIR